MARAFGTFRFLHELPAATTFNEVRFSLPGTFPFDLHFYEVDKGFDCNFFELAWGVKRSLGIDPSQQANLKRVVVAQRKPSESRHMNNSSELLLALEGRGFNASAVTFGELSFPDQLRAVSEAAVLVGVTGSDLVNLVFLPLNAVIIEVFPIVQGEQVFTPELWHLAQMTGKQHLKYVSPYNSSVLRDDQGHVIGDKPVHQVKATDVHVPSLTALIESASLMVKDSIRTKAEITEDGKCTLKQNEWYLSWLNEHM